MCAKKRRKMEKAEKPSEVISSADFWLDSYQEIFSDFDPAPYERRIVSQDFIDAVMRRFPEGSDEPIHLRISLPKSVRSVDTEHIIVNRLKKYFRKMAARYEKRMGGEQKQGAAYFIAGCILLLAFVWLGLNLETITSEILGILFLPLGWFGVWEGTSRILNAPEQYKKKLGLYYELSQAKYEFISEEDLLKKIKKK